MLESEEEERKENRLRYLPRKNESTSNSVVGGRIVSDHVVRESGGEGLDVCGSEEERRRGRERVRRVGNDREERENERTFDLLDLLVGQGDGEG